MRSKFIAQPDQLRIPGRIRMRRVRRLRPLQLLSGTLLLSLFSAFVWPVSAQNQKAVCPGDARISETPDISVRLVSSSTENDVEKLKTVVADQQKRIEQLERMLNDERKLIEQALHLSLNTNVGIETASVPKQIERVSSTKNSPEAAPAIAGPLRKNQSRDEEKAAPLALRIGTTSITPYGFLDLTTIIRDKNV